MLRAITTLVALSLVVAILGGAAALAVLYRYGQALPDYLQLAVYEPAVTSRVYAGDGRLMAEYATERRVFVPIPAIPKRVVQAFLSAEDKNFYSHPGIDAIGVVRAVLTNLRNWGTDRRPVGASTITQQVAKNFLIGNEVSVDRKIKEAILAFRMERALSKDRLLELYLNEIYLGFASYGVSAAALNYFNRSLDELTLAEAAFLAALPKAPNNYHPLRFPAAAKERRDWALGRMLEDGYITAAQAREAAAEPIAVRRRDPAEVVRADYFAEEVRRDLLARYGEDRVYRGGLAVRTSLDPHLQAIADRVLRAGLEDYDRRHGYRGPVAAIAAVPGWQRALIAVPAPPGLGARQLAVVLRLDEDAAQIGLPDGSGGRIALADLKWARRLLPGGGRGPAVTRPSDALAAGDVVIVEPAEPAKEGERLPPGSYSLKQIPEVEGALVALDPHTGRVRALAGGYDYARSQFNRATQAQRQPGSAFKPFVYLAALDSGYTPTTLINDAPFVYDQGPGLPKWRPENYTSQFYGPSTMRLGIEKSRNLMTVRLAQEVGMDKVAAYAERFGVVDRLEPHLAMSLGAGETTVLRLTAAYAMLVNGGKRIVPSLIDRVQDRAGRTVFRHDDRTCRECKAMHWTGQTAPLPPDPREQLTDPGSAYQMVSMLQGVVERGTGVRVKELNRPLAGKTGTTNDSLDAWFVGFSPDLAVGVFVGFDAPQSLGDRETGSSVAVPIFKAFMADALQNQPKIPFRIPPGIRLTRVQADSGAEARPGDRNVIFEAFKPGTGPSAGRQVVEGLSVETAPATGTGGLY